VLSTANKADLYALCSLSRCVEKECGFETLNEIAWKGEEWEQRIKYHRQRHSHNIMFMRATPGLEMKHICLRPFHQPVSAIIYFRVTVFISAVFAIYNSSLEQH
jgi:hypothetical protein